MENYTPSLLPACLLTEDPALGVAPSDTTASMAGGWLAQLVGTLFSPGYHITVSSCWLLFSCHLRGPQITCSSVPVSPLHTNSSALFLSLGLSLWGLLIHTVVCSHRAWYCRYVMQNERRDDLSFSTAVFPVVLLLVLYSPGSEAPLVLCFLLPEWDSLDLTLLI